MGYITFFPSNNNTAEGSESQQKMQMFVSRQDSTEPQTVAVTNPEPLKLVLKNKKQPADLGDTRIALRINENNNNGTASRLHTDHIDTVQVPDNNISVAEQQRKAF